VANQSRDEPRTMTHPVCPSSSLKTSSSSRSSRLPVRVAEALYNLYHDHLQHHSPFARHIDNHRHACSSLQHATSRPHPLTRLLRQLATTMSQPPALNKAQSAGKIATNSNSSISPAASRAEQSFSSTSTGRFSAASSRSQSQQSAPRNNQSSRPKHKAGKKYSSQGLLDDDEVVAMNSIGRRGKQADITHLMNISLPPRPQQQYHRHSYNGPNRRRAAPSWGFGSGYHAVDKARYIHANYRFIVNPQGDYTAQAADADVHLDWSTVLQVIASPISQQASCPICLGEPTAPRMAKCGHMFCMPCLIRYMHSDDGEARPGHERRARWKKCPICEDSIYVSETRPVRWYAGQEAEHLREGSDLVLRLVKRKASSTLAMPRESMDVVPKGEAIPWYSAAEVMDYARVMKGSEDYMVEEYEHAINAIRAQEKEDELMFGEDAEWTSRAVRMLHEAKEKVKGIGNPPAQPKKPEPKPAEEARPPIHFNESDEGVPEMYLHSQASAAPQIPTATEHSDQQSVTNDTPSMNYVPRTIHEMRQRPVKPEPPEYLFYQAPLHYYLSPLDIRILRAAFGSYAAFPSSILPRIERVSNGHIVDDELRKRIKYLGHLPYGCEVSFLECDWTDTVPSHILEDFRPMLDRRRKRHDEKEAREEKERIRIERIEEKELAHLRRSKRVIPLADDPTMSMEWEALPTPIAAQHGHVPVSDHEHGEGASSPPWTNRTAGSGFASLASPSTSPNVHRTVWGTAAVAPASPDLHTALPTDNEWSQRDDGWLQGWERDIMDGSALAAEVQGMGSGDQDVPAAQSSKAAANGGGGGGGKKGKKGKKITLMSTTARRGA